MPTALLIERDRQYLPVRRRMRYTCTVGEWESPIHREAAIARAWKAGVAAIRSEGEYELITPAPVVLWRSRTDGEILFADLTVNPAAPRWILPDGSPLGMIPWTGLLTPQRTTYTHWAEGPLPHLDLTPTPAPELDREIEYYRHQNAALREQIDRAIGLTARMPPARSADEHPGLVDFRICGIFRRPDIRVFQSKQGNEDVKAEIGGEIIEFPEDGKDDAS